ncbi:DNA import protein CedA1 [Sulfuracidifex tepidarius]|uniref:DNA import protein CedA1 n=1 Tax=Sulfuracidifex tepidarius TaxID=1294262 RepID=A0A510DVZ9_9CREN|nr:DNA import protein CedA1 [Sulfuracidifex tepidarius]BBG24375.1 DNA import protein CedA1 [Sulfuracidifex tepidarius]BBG27133.1 DNA import protein CedA1 [Sulfuracidifex tepidarius]
MGNSIVTLINTTTSDVTAAAWALFILSWAAGWAIRGSPIPIFRVKRTGQDFIEDAILAAFWIAVGSTVFSFISYIAGQI